MSVADFGFLLHGFHFLKDEGLMAIIVSGEERHRGDGLPYLDRSRVVIV